jgi:hypothetical protein
MKRVVCSICLIFLAAAVSHASLTINPDAVKRATVFIFPADANGKVDPTKPEGTAFLVSIPIVGSNRSYIVLVTARHIPDPSWAGCNEPNPSTVFVRLNRKSYDPAKDATGVAYVRINLREPNGGLGYVVPSDDQIDAAAIPLKIADFSDPSYELTTIPLDVFATDDELSRLTTGDAIVSAGLVPGAQGTNRNYPVFKFGFISDNRPEPFVTGCGQGLPGRSEKVWFISMNMFPGASGSAIFYAPPGSGGVQFGAPVMRPILIGIQSSSILNADVAGMTSIGLAFPMFERLHLPNADLHRGPRPLETPPQTPIK